MIEYDLKKAISMSVIVLSALVIVLSGIHSAQAAQYKYEAVTIASRAAKQSPVTIGRLTWRCTGNRCQISGPWPTPIVAACAALARKVGRIRSYGYQSKGGMLTPAQLRQCNRGVAARIATGRIAAGAKRQPRRRAPGSFQARPGSTLVARKPGSGSVAASVGQHVRGSKGQRPGGSLNVEAANSSAGSSQAHATLSPYR